MAHEEEHESEGGGERWLVSYADFITLLMVLFVVLYSLGQTDVQKYKQLAESMRAAFTLGGEASDVVNVQINEGSSVGEDGQANPIVVPGIPSDPPKSEEVANQLTQMLAMNNLGSEVSVQTNVEGVLISLSEKLVFESGTAELPDEVYPILDVIVQMLDPIDNSIRLVGHTDDTPPRDSRYENNMELSVARAMVVADYLIEGGIAPERLVVSGRGEYHPIFPNDTAEHRALNGRVEIVIIYNVENSVLGIDSIDVAP